MSQTESQTVPTRVPRWRRILVAFLVVVACVLAPLSVAGVWLRNTILNTDQYVETVAPLAQNPAVQDAVARRITTAVIEGTDLKRRIADALPEKATFIAPYIANGLESFVHDETLRIVQSDQFANLWEQANRRAHTLVVGLLKGEGTDRVDVKDGRVVVKLGSVVEKVQEKLQDLGVDAFSGSDKAAKGELVLIDSSDLRQVQGAVDLLDTLATVLPILTVALFAAAIALSPRRRRTILRSGLGIALGMAIVLTLLKLGRSFYLDALGPNVSQDAAAAVFDQLVSFLRDALRTMFALGVVVALGAWLAGPSRGATKVRGGAKHLVDLAAGKSNVPSPVANFVSRAKAPLQVAVVGVGALILILLTNPGPLAVLVIALLVLVGLLVIEVLARRASDSEKPGAQKSVAK